MALIGLSYINRKVIKFYAPSIWSLEFPLAKVIIIIFVWVIWTWQEI